MKKTLAIAVLLTSVVAVAKSPTASPETKEQNITISSDANTGNGNQTPAVAPMWQRIGNTGLVTQNWWIQFDNRGTMYVSSNNPYAGGVAKSTDKGAHWTTIDTGFTCNLHRGMGLALDGALFVGNDYCTDYGQGANHFYWLDNVSGSGTHWTRVTTPSGNGGGQIGKSVIASDGRTIVSGTYSGIWLSTDNARSWQLAPGSPQQGPVGSGVGEFLVTHKQPDGTLYVGVARGGVYYSKDNGSHWTRLGYPPGNTGNGNFTGGDIWAMNTAPAGPVQGYLMLGAGNPAAQNSTGTGLWCYGPQAPPYGHWVYCGNNQYIQGQTPIDVTQIVVNNSKTKAIAIYYGDRGNSPMYTVDGMNWNGCSTGLPRDSSTFSGGANTQGMAIDPTTGYVYIVLKNGDIYRTTVPQ